LGRRNRRFFIKGFPEPKYEGWGFTLGVLGTEDLFPKIFADFNGSPWGEKIGDNKPHYEEKQSFSTLFFKQLMIN
jgi:hypothetical protein